MESESGVVTMKLPVRGTPTLDDAALPPAEAAVAAAANAANPDPAAVEDDDDLEDEYTDAEDLGDDAGTTGPSESSFGGKPARRKRNEGQIKRAFRKWISDPRTGRRLSKISVALLVITQVLSTIAFSITTALTAEGEYTFKYLADEVFPVVVQLNTVAWRVWKENEVVSRAIVSRSSLTSEGNCTVALDRDTSVFLAETWLHREYLGFEIANVREAVSPEIISATEMTKIGTLFAKQNASLFEVIAGLEAGFKQDFSTGFAPANATAGGNSGNNGTTGATLDWAIMDTYMNASQEVLETVNKWAAKAEKKFLDTCSKEAGFARIDSMFLLLFSRFLFFGCMRGRNEFFFSMLIFFFFFFFDSHNQPRRDGHRHRLQNHRNSIPVPFRGVRQVPYQVRRARRRRCRRR
jgi:hypothetical protein